ncbi:MAG: redox-regulated ATPase YchF [candidate division NC10 bacterium]|nr:redox-regulated ATPase YchF [candidate division NC10 bacterium]
MRFGLVGLPASGKTTVFHLLHRVKGEARPTSAEVAIAQIKVPDPRLDFLAALFKPKKMTPVALEYHDFHAPAKAMPSGAILTPQVLVQLRTMDALLVVIRAFEDARVPHMKGTVDPARDIALIASEFVMADLEIVEKRIGRIEENLKKGKKDENPKELELLKGCRGQLEAGVPIRDLSFSPEEDRRLRGFQLLTQKPHLYLLNTGETAPQLQGPPGPLQEACRHNATALLALPAKVELEMMELSPEEAEVFRKELGLPEPALDRLIKACYELLGLITFFTVVGDELRAWAIPRGSTAQKAAGTIHSDMEKGFIKAEVVPLDALQASGSMAEARRHGVLRLEGKDYIVQDGDILTIRFST